MPKFHTFPTLYDECKTISISFLNKHGYLNADQWRSGTITWSRGEGEYKQITGRISIVVDTFSESPYLELDYKLNDKPINYKVQLLNVPSNIGKGVVWFFICPITGKRCRKLYLADTYFLHREAFRGCMYDKQTKSKKWREFQNIFGFAFESDEAYEEIHSKNFKTHYAGKPTKRYQRLMRKIDATNKSISERELLKLFN
jgi:hypothetical protein